MNGCRTRFPSAEEANMQISDTSRVENPAGGGREPESLVNASSSSCIPEARFRGTRGRAGKQGLPTCCKVSWKGINPNNGG